MEKPISELHILFEKHKNNQKSTQMESYLKNKFRFFGINATPRRELTFGVWKKYPITESTVLIHTCQQLWDLPEREFHLAALDLLVKHKKIIPAASLGEIKQFIVKRSWWDTVDCLAVNLVGMLVKKNPILNLEMDKWIEDKDLWLNRSAILFQLKYKDDLNWDKLKSYITLHQHSKEFFLQKAIGWVLREYSKTKPQRIKEFVKERDKLLSTLSKREALKWMNFHI